MKKRFPWVFCLFLVALSALAADMSIVLEADTEETVRGIQEALKVWALNPTSLTACSGDCCVSATDDQCKNLAREVLQNQSEKIARDLFPCIQSNSTAFLCSWWVRADGQNEMVCETFPGASQALVDSATCAAQLAATRF